jgi:hypothetical protein
MLSPLPSVDMLSPLPSVDMLSPLPSVDMLSPLPFDAAGSTSSLPQPAANAVNETNVSKVINFFMCLSS